MSNFVEDGDTFDGAYSTPSRTKESMAAEIRRLGLQLAKGGSPRERAKIKKRLTELKREFQGLFGTVTPPRVTFTPAQHIKMIKESHTGMVRLLHGLATLVEDMPGSMVGSLPADEITDFAIYLEEKVGPMVDDLADRAKK